MIFGWNVDGKYLVFYNKFFFVLGKCVKFNSIFGIILFLEDLCMN